MGKNDRALEKVRKHTEKLDAVRGESLAGSWPSPPSGGRGEVAFGLRITDLRGDEGAFFHCERS
jgi:hypothetical protein